MGEPTGQSSQLGCWAVAHPYGHALTHVPGMYPDARAAGRVAGEKSQGGRLDRVRLCSRFPGRSRPGIAVLCARQRRACQFLHNSRRREGLLIEFFLDASR